MRWRGKSRAIQIEISRIASNETSVTRPMRGGLRIASLLALFVWLCPDGPFRPLGEWGQPEEAPLAGERRIALWPVEENLSRPPKGVKVGRRHAVRALNE